jgi:hypothetical protein
MMLEGSKNVSFEQPFGFFAFLCFCMKIGSEDKITKTKQGNQPSLFESSNNRGPVLLADPQTKKELHLPQPQCY